MVIQFTASAGNIANHRVTVQNGEADVTFLSETETSNVVAKIDAQINEAQGDYKPLIGKVFGTTNILLAPVGTDISTKTIITGATSDVADRITLNFSKDVTVKNFVLTTADGKTYLVYQNTDSSNPLTYTTDVTKVGNAVTYAGNDGGYGVAITQPGTGKTFRIRGFAPVAGNTKAITVILDKSTTLTDNADVDVDFLDATNVHSAQSFTLTDPRPAEPTSVSPQGLKGVNVVFSEPITTPNLGQVFVDGAKLDLNNINVPSLSDSDKIASNLNIKNINPVAGNNHVDVLTTGDFDQNAFTDERNVLSLNLGTYKNNVYDTDGVTVLHHAGDQAYITSGNHSIQLSGIRDFAGLTDDKNISTTQTLGFTVASNNVIPAVASITAQSPEQFDVKFNCDVNPANAMAGIKLYTMDSTGKYNTITSSNVKLDKAGHLLGDPGINVQRVSDSEYIVQLNKDWTDPTVYNTAVTNQNYYNGKFALSFASKSLVNPANGNTNSDEIVSAITGNVISTPDVTSPVINKIDVAHDNTANAFDVVMSEPVKLVNQLDDPNYTVTAAQGNLQTTTVQFLGKDANGNTVTVDGTVVPYVNQANSSGDTVFKVTPNKVGAKTLQQLVDAGTYQENWTVVVKSISDDVGNTAATLTKDFKITKNVAAEDFFAYNSLSKMKIDLDGNKQDKLYITFSEPVTVTGNVENATDASNYVLDGNTLPSGTSITLVNDIAGDDGIADNTICIALPDGYLTKAKEHTLVVAKSLKSANGSLYDTAHAVQLQLPSTDIAKAINAKLTGANVAVDMDNKEITVSATDGTKAVADLVTAGTDASNLDSITINGTKVAINGSLDSTKLGAIKTALGLSSTTTYNDLKTAGPTVTLTIGGVDYKVTLK